ncbi:hypothetical protein WJX84_003732 [Apatococcus fuscideae]|uniref:Lon proteolytic domain-containing protein n=1 Tax=Apatococcus fuscideae TaxID=2026836 RepID=A0AAW1TB07_9CHLO
MSRSRAVSALAAWQHYTMECKASWAWHAQRRDLRNTVVAGLTSGCLFGAFYLPARGGGRLRGSLLGAGLGASVALPVGYLQQQLQTVVDSKSPAPEIPSTAAGTSGQQREMARRIPRHSSGTTDSGGGNQGPAGRYPNGVNRDRFSLLTAVLQKHAKLRLYTVDIHTNVVGGLAVKEPASDLAIAVAIASSYYESPVPPTIAVIGEIGLGGEIRPVSHLDRRLIEAAKLGFTTAVVPRTPSGMQKQGGKSNRGIATVECATISEALHAVLGPPQHRN